MNRLRLEAMLRRFFDEDIGSGDLSADTVFAADTMGEVRFYVKEDGVFCGADVIRCGFALLDARAQVELYCEDGARVTSGDVLARISAPVRCLLSGERVVLNMVQRMSGIATMTARAVACTVGSGAKICDTRKTMPGLRMPDKYAVRVGGGFNHRYGLYDAVMLKDNHIAFAGSLQAAVAQVRAQLGHTVKIEVEIENENMLHEAIAANADIIMFDNCTPENIRAWIHHVPPHIATEASGGINLDNLPAYAASGVQWISLGFLTHSVSALDISARVKF
ncbi:MAG: carboxylating nicotinate-nucleotide diphosphorylase [Neisseria sp.]|nr:carboxylating nicotinate-nucleotide diphosphorylase [Neisseria sp.]